MYLKICLFVGVSRYKLCRYSVFIVISLLVNNTCVGLGATSNKVACES